MLEKLVRKENGESIMTSTSFSPLSNLRKSFRRLKAKRYRRALSEGIPGNDKTRTEDLVDNIEDNRSKKRKEGKKNSEKHKNGKAKFSVVQWSSCESMTDTIKRKPGKHNSLRRSKASLLMPMSSDINKRQVSPSKTKITRYNSIDLLNDSAMYENKWCSSQDMTKESNIKEVIESSIQTDKTREIRQRNPRRRKHSSSLPNISEANIEKSEAQDKDIVFHNTAQPTQNEIARKRQHRLSLQQEDLDMYQKQADDAANKINEYCNVSLTKKKFHQSMFLSTISLNSRPPLPSVPKPISKRDNHLKSASTEHLPSKYCAKQSREFVEQYLVLSRKLKRSEVIKSFHESSIDESFIQSFQSDHQDKEKLLTEPQNDVEFQRKLAETKWKSLLSSYQVPLAIAEALFDHTSLGKDELTFESGDVIKVLFMEDDNWWWGCTRDEKEGWFAASFVRLRVVQEIDADESNETENERKYSNLNQEISILGLETKIRDKNKVLTVRAKCVEELLNTEIEYVKMLRNIIEGYLYKVRVDSLFTEDDAQVIFSNIEYLYEFHREFLQELKAAVHMNAMEQSCVGQVFLKHQPRFEIYSKYCNNQPLSSARLSSLCKNKKVDIFMESCRLRQNMIRLSLDGFLLSPVQRICKYPLQLKELLKHTLSDHPDYESLLSARSCMQDVASLINERKRRLENVRKLALWQYSVNNWRDEDLVLKSSDLIFRGDIHMFTNGKNVDRVVYLFDHQLIYFKRENVKRKALTYEGRINLDESTLEIIDNNTLLTERGESIQNAWKLSDNLQESINHIFYTEDSAKRDEWLEAFKKERQHVTDEHEKGFKVLHEFRLSAIEDAYNKQIAENKRNRLRRKSIATNEIDLEILLPQFTADGKIESNYNFTNLSVTKRTSNKSRTKSFRLSLTERTLLQKS